MGRCLVNRCRLDFVFAMKKNLSLFILFFFFFNSTVFAYTVKESYFVTEADARAFIAAIDSNYGKIYGDTWCSASISGFSWGCHKNLSGDGSVLHYAFWTSSGVCPSPLVAVSGQCITPSSPPPGYDPNIDYPSPDGDGNCAVGQTVYLSKCVPDVAPPVVGDSAGRGDLRCGTGSMPVCDYVNPYSSKDGWTTYADSNDYVSQSEGGGCRRYEGDASWYCTHDTYYNGATQNGVIHPVPVNPSSDVASFASPSSVVVDTSTSYAQTSTNPDTQVVTTTTTTPTTTTTTQYDPATDTHTTTTTDNTTNETTTTSGSGQGLQPGGTSSNPDYGQNGDTGTYADGGCVSPPSCSGDVVACGVSYQAWKIRCLQEKSLEIDGSEGHYSQSDPFKSGAIGDTEKKSVNADGAFDFDILESFQEKRKNYLNFASGCMGNITINLFHGQSVSVDLSVLCRLGDIIRFILHMAAYLLAIRLIHKTLV